MNIVLVAIGKSNARLPIGVQIVGKRWQDLELLAIAKKITRMTSGFYQPPSY